MFTLMIADDEALARFALKAVLNRCFDNISVVAEAETGVEALELYKTIRPDGVIMDIKLPLMSGLQAAKEILGGSPQAKILICSAYDSFSYVSEAMDLGIKGYLLKPVNAQEALEKIPKLFDPIISVPPSAADRSGKVSSLVEQCVNRIVACDIPAAKEALNEWVGEAFAYDTAYAFSQCIILLSMICRQQEKIGCSLGYGRLLELARNVPLSKAPLESQLRTCVEEAIASFEKHSKKSDGVIQAILDRVSDENISTITLEGMAREMSVSPQYLSRIFKERTGMNFIEFITQKRMLLSHELLRNSCMRIQDIALKCGYNDPVYFKKVFKKTFGVPPNELRGIDA